MHPRESRRFQHLASAPLSDGVQCRNDLSEALVSGMNHKERQVHLSQVRASPWISCAGTSSSDCQPPQYLASMVATHSIIDTMLLLVQA